MWFLRNSSAIVIGVVLGIVGFMIYHQETALPLADVMGTQLDTPGKWDISYQLSSTQLTITNNSDTLIGTLSIPITYDPSSIKFTTDAIISNYEYSFDTARKGKITILISGTLKPGQLITIPLQWDSNNISISSPSIVNGDTSSSLSITRIE